MSFIRAVICVGAIAIGAASALAYANASGRGAGLNGSELQLVAPFPNPKVAGSSTSPGALFAGEVAVLRRHGLSAPRARRAIKVQDAFARAGMERKLQAAMAGAYAGVWYEPVRAQFHVGVTSAASRREVAELAAREGLADAVTETPVHSTWPQLLAAQESWYHRLASLFARYQVETSIEPQRNAVAIRLSSSVSVSTRAALRREAAGDGVRAIVTVVPYPELRLVQESSLTKCNLFEAGNKAKCEKPITPGVVIDSPRNFCTAGPLAVGTTNKDDTYMLTAGHCISRAGGARVQWNALSLATEWLAIGTATRQFFNNRNGDVGAIKVNSPGRWTNTGATPAFPVTAEWAKLGRTSFPVKGEQYPIVGTSNCIEGKTTGASCGKVKAVDVQDLRVRGLAEDEEASNEEGDSGGPVITATKGEYVVEGTLVGRVRATSQSVYEPLETAFLELGARGLHLELLTPTNETRAKESEEEKEANKKEETLEKSEIETKEKEEKEPTKILPEAFATSQLYSTDKSGVIVTLALGGLRFECKSSTGTSEYTSNDSGEFTTLGAECKGPAASTCTAVGDAKGLVAFQGELDYWLALASAKFVPASIYLFDEAHITCEGVGLKDAVLVKGCAAGLAEPIEKATTSIKGVFKEEKGVSEITKVLPAESTKEVGCVTEVSVNGGKFEEAGESATREDETFEQGPEEPEVTLMR